MLANQNLLIETMQAGHRHTESVLALLGKACAKLSVGDVEAECDYLRAALKDTNSMFATLKDASTADLSQVLGDVKKYAGDVVAAESRTLQGTLAQASQKTDSDLNERFKKLEARVLSEMATGGGGGEDSGGLGASRRAGDGQLLKKVTNRMSDFEAQVSSQLQLMTQDIEKKIAFIGAKPGGGAGGGPLGGPGLDSLAHDLDAIKYDIGELKDLCNGSKNDTSHVKRLVLACERDMEDFTAAMDAVNVDLDEMRARVDSTHSIITSRQRVEATVTAEISTMRLDMGDMQEALKAHDAWMEDVSQSLQEAHERCHQLAEDLGDLRDQTQAKLDAKTDVTAWNDMNDDIDASIKTVRDMASALRLEVDSRRRKVDETLNQVRGELNQLEGKVDTNQENIHRVMEESKEQLHTSIELGHSKSRELELVASRHVEIHRELHTKMDDHRAGFDTRHEKTEAELRRQGEDFHKESNDRMDGIERQQGTLSKENSKRLNALDLRISGLQGASGELKRDSNKLRDEVNSMTVKSAAHDVDIGKACDDLRKLERCRAEDNQRQKQETDAIYEELDQKVYEKSFQALEDNTRKLTRGTVKLCQVVGVFPGARMNDGTEEELDVDVDLLQWEDCAQNLTARVEKVWRQISSQKYRSLLDLVSKKADHSVLRLLQISQQHIESQLDRVRHERELWKEVVDKRAQQPLQLALALKDPHTGQPIQNPGAMYGTYGAPPGSMQQQQMMMGHSGGFTPRLPAMVAPDHTQAGHMVESPDQPGGAMKGSAMTKRPAKPPASQGPPQQPSTVR